MKKLLTISLLVLLIGSFSSCSVVKRAYYFNDLKPGTEKIDSAILGSFQRIQKGDGVSVVITSKDPTLTAYLNPLSYGMSGVNPSGQQSGFQGYRIDNEGTITLPLIGKVKLEGLTTRDASEEIRKRVEFYYKDPYVVVSVVGKVTVLTSQGGASVPIVNERITIFEALAQASTQAAFNPSDRRNAVWVIREDSGKRVYAQVNLNKRDIFNSPYYYLRTNDMVYVEPGKFATFATINTPLRNTLLILGSVAAIIFAVKK
jgi:polysaccharide export outer membrane protein